MMKDKAVGDPKMTDKGTIIEWQNVMHACWGFLFTFLTLIIIYGPKSVPFNHELCIINHIVLDVAKLYMQGC